VIGDLQDLDSNYLYVARLKGSAYEMGKAYGKLFREELIVQQANFFKYYIAYLKKMIKKGKLPPFIANLIATDHNIKATLNTLLDLNVFMTKKYTNKRYFD
jgi:hypothetical protein